MGKEPGAAVIVEHYQNFLNVLVMDESDCREVEQISGWGIITLLTDIRMPTREERRRLANELLAFCETH
jgi:hypothetical protein